MRICGICFGQVTTPDFVVARCRCAMSLRIVEPRAALLAWASPAGLGKALPIGGRIAAPSSASPIHIA